MSEIALDAAMVFLNKVCFISSSFVPVKTTTNAYSTTKEVLCSSRVAAKMDLTDCYLDS